MGKAGNVKQYSLSTLSLIFLYFVLSESHVLVCEALSIHVYSSHILMLLHDCWRLQNNFHTHSYHCIFPLVVQHYTSALAGWLLIWTCIGPLKLQYMFSCFALQLCAVFFFTFYLCDLNCITRPMYMSEPVGKFHIQSIFKNCKNQASEMSQLSSLVHQFVQKTLIRTIKYSGSLGLRLSPCKHFILDV